MHTLTQSDSLPLATASHFVYCYFYSLPLEILKMTQVVSALRVMGTCTSRPPVSSARTKTDVSVVLLGATEIVLVALFAVGVAGPGDARGEWPTQGSLGTT